MSRAISLASVLLLLLASIGCGRHEPTDADTARGTRTVIRIGHFPNVTHAQALVARHLSRKEAPEKGTHGWFEDRLGADVTFEWYAYNAGPSAMEAVFSGALDVTYVGPNPALNAYARSRGEEIRILSGSARGGAALVVQPDGSIEKPEDFRGKRVGTPQLGNTQDVAARAWLSQQGFRVTQQGGDVAVLPTANPDQLALFRQKGLDAVWTVEPWVSRLEIEGGGKVFLDESDAVTTILVSSAKFLREKPELARKLAEAHAELTAWMGEHVAEAQALVAAELREETTREFPRAIIEQAWKRLRFTTELEPASLVQFVEKAKVAGFIREFPDLSRLVEPLGRTAP